jgi:hypothetical protein
MRSHCSKREFWWEKAAQSPSMSGMHGPGVRERIQMIRCDAWRSDGFAFVMRVAECLGQRERARGQPQRQCVVSVPGVQEDDAGKTRTTLSACLYVCMFVCVCVYVCA